MKTFLIRLDPDQQKELLEKMKANSKRMNSSQDYSSSLSTLTGADIVRESEKKPHGFSDAQIEDLQKKLAGRVLTFEDGEVSMVMTDINMDGSVCIIARFGTDSFLGGKDPVRSFRVRAYFPKPETDRLIKTIDEGAHIKSLEGRVISNGDKPQPLDVDIFTVIDAKIVLSEK